jgi:hypothetical protein
MDTLQPLPVKPIDPRRGLALTNVESFLLEGLRTTLRLGFNTPGTFLKHFSAHYIMMKFGEGSHDLRGELLKAVLGLALNTGMELDPATAGTLLQAAVKTEDATSDRILEALESDEIGLKEVARYFNPQDVWSFITLTPWWNVEGLKEGEDAKAFMARVLKANECMEALLNALLDARLITKQTLVDQIGIPYLTKCLHEKSPEVAYNLLTEACKLGRKNVPTGADVILDFATVKVIAWAVPLDHLFENVVLQAALAAKLVDGSPAGKAPPRGIPSEHPPVSIMELGSEARIQRALLSDSTPTLEPGKSDHPVASPPIPPASPVPPHPSPGGDGVEGSGEDEQ